MKTSTVHPILLPLIVTLLFSYTFSGAQTANLAKAAGEKLIPGIAVSVYDLGKNELTALPELLPKQLPNRYAVIPNIQLSDKNPRQQFSFLKENNSYYVVLSGYINLPNTKDHSFHLNSCDGSVLKIDGKTVADLNGVHGPIGTNADMHLKAGLHPFEIHYFTNHTSLAKELHLYWFNEKENTSVHVPIPDSFFVHPPQEVKVMAGVKEFEPQEKVLPSDKSPLAGLHPSLDLITIRKRDFMPRVGGIDFFKDGRMVICTWDSLGQVFLIDGLETNDTNKITVKRIAWGLAEPLGIKVVNDRDIYVMQKQELTQLVDTDGNELTDEYRTICNAWEVTANFHEFGFGLLYRDGYFYASLATAVNPGGRGTIPQAKDRGKVIKIGLDGSYETVAEGLRTPNGLGIGPEGEMFVADNEGDWLPSSKIVHVKQGAFYGSFAVDIHSAGRKRVTPPVVWLPQGEIGNSPSQPLYFNEGPYQGQLIHGDVTYGGIQRVFMEKVEDEYQGIVFKFTQGLESGVNRLALGPDGALYAGGVGSGSNWGQYGKLDYGLQKLKYNGKSTFEMLAVRAKTNGMEIEFTQPLKEGSGNTASDYQVLQWRYESTIQYGGPKIGVDTLAILSVTVAADRKKVFLELDGLKQGHVVYFHLNNRTIISHTDNSLWSTEGWYTLNHIPDNNPGIVLSSKKTALSTRKIVGAATTTSEKAPTQPVKTEKSKDLSESELLAAGSKLIANSGCKACHAIDKKVVGPAFRMVAQKYERNKATIEKLVDKVTNGGSGVWGEMGMPPQPHLQEEQISTMVQYILSLPEKKQ